MNISPDKAWAANKIHYVLKEDTNMDIMDDIEWTTLKVRYEQELEARYARVLSELMNTGVQEELERWIDREDLGISYCCNRVLEHYRSELEDLCKSLRVPFDSERIQKAFSLPYNKSVCNLIKRLIEGKEDTK